MSLVSKLTETRDGLVAEVEAALASEDVTPEVLDAVTDKQAEIEKVDERIATVKAAEARSAALAESRKEAGVKTFGGAVVTREEMTYDKAGRNSFVRDMINAQLRNDASSWERLNRHQQEVAVETRDISRTDGAGGDFVPPIMALPAGTDSINIPAITTGTLAAFQSADNTATTTRDMVSSTVTAPVRTVSGYENVSIQLVEQSPLAGGLDRLVFGDLMADYALQVNTAALANNDGSSAGAIKGLLYSANAGLPVTWTETTPTGVNGLKAIAQGISSVVTNRYKAPEGIIMHPSTWYWFLSQVDGSNRPLVVPVSPASQAFNANGTATTAGAPAGLVGTIHGVPVYIDATMSKVYNTNQSPIIVGKFSDSYLFESGVKTRVLPDVLSANLTVRFQVYGYLALAHRYAKSAAAISGTGAVAPSGY